MAPSTSHNVPQLLKLNSIGPADELRSFDIPVLEDLPGVGTNMQVRYESKLSRQMLSRTMFDISPVPVNVKHDDDFAILDGRTFDGQEHDECLKQWLNSPSLLGQKVTYASTD